MKKQMVVLALAATTLAVAAGCRSGSTSSSAPDGEPLTVADASPNDATSNSALGSPSPAPDPSTTRPATGPGVVFTKKPVGSKPAPSTSASSPAGGARIVSFTLVQKPRCPEGTAVFRAPAVPAIIKWTITGATGAALSVDDPTHTAGTYGPEPLSGTETFTFGCHGPVGSTEKHTYAIYTVGGGPQHSKTITATAKVIDDGKN